MHQATAGEHQENSAENAILFLYNFSIIYLQRKRTFVQDISDEILRIYTELWPGKTTF